MSPTNDEENSGQISLIPVLLLIPTLICEASLDVSGMSWWGWPTALFFTTFFMGVFGVMVGISGGVFVCPTG